VRVDGRLLVDGGLRNTVPSEVAKAMGADFIVAVDVGYCVKKGRITNIFQVLFQSMQIIGSELNRHETMSADVVINVPLGEEVDQMAFDKAAHIISVGEKAAEDAVPDIIRLIKIRGHAG
jgi:NTE family protein